MVAIKGPHILAGKSLAAAANQDTRRKRIRPRAAGRGSIRIRAGRAQAAFI